MNTPQLSLFAAFAALLLPVIAPAARAEPSAGPEPLGEIVYVAVEVFASDSIRFERLRYALATGDELFLATLKGSAREQATLAGYQGKVVVLDENAQPPAGATVLRLTWNGNAVGAEVSQAGGKGKYLGVVNSLGIEHHPNSTSMRRSIDSAGLPNAQRDAAWRAELQMDLFQAFKYLVRYQKNQAAKP